MNQVFAFIRTSLTLQGPLFVGHIQRGVLAVLVPHAFTSAVFFFVALIRPTFPSGSFFQLLAGRHFTSNYMAAREFVTYHNSIICRPPNVII